MVPGRGQCNGSLARLDSRRELLIESIKQCATKRDYYISKNERNEKELERLGRIKEDLLCVKDVLLQDLYKVNVNAGKRGKLFSKGLQEFHRKSCTMKMENLPGACQLKELVESNEKLHAEHVICNESLISLKEEYSKVVNMLRNNFKIKVIEFVKEFLQMTSLKDSTDNIALH